MEVESHKNLTIDLLSKKNNIYTLRINGNSAFNFLKYIYYNDNLLSINRKKERANFIINRAHKQILLNESEIQSLIKDYKSISY